MEDNEWKMRIVLNKYNLVDLTNELDSIIDVIESDPQPGGFEGKHPALNELRNRLLEARGGLPSYEVDLMDGDKRKMMNDEQKPKPRIDEDWMMIFLTLGCAIFMIAIMIGFLYLWTFEIGQ